MVAKNVQEMGSNEYKTLLVLDKQAGEVKFKIEWLKCLLRILRISFPCPNGC